MGLHVFVCVLNMFGYHCPIVLLSGVCTSPQNFIIRSPHGGDGLLSVPDSVYCNLPFIKKTSKTHVVNLLLYIFFPLSC